MSDPIIHVSFPMAPDAYPTTLHWHAQLSRHVFAALSARFGARVRFSPWTAPLEPAGRDVLVSFQPHPALTRWKRSVLIENSNFDVDKWRHAAFRRFGLNAPTDAVAAGDAALRHQYALVVLSNDVAIRRVAARDPQVAACYDHMASLARHLSVHPHPIDKVEFSRLATGFATPAKTRMLVYHAGPRKNSAELIATLRDIGLQENSDFSVAAHVPKDRADLMAFLRQNFLVVANTSYSETGPINMIEYLLSGFAVYGHDDWWDGAGNPRFTWSYDPAAQETNRANLRHIFHELGPDGVAAERDRVRTAFLERSDNDWPALLGPVCAHVEALLDSDHPGRVD
ncbi:hypothetical protein [Azospirillum sp. TSO35-2]|uniref:hypothetical protein n=1 Tax=Azospirillum sp. TSO35-2 TaxID=716796 RepID=UPI000D60CC5F|nr:hypothetical protein [Azospirillum sp. TSO35-2]PWC36503.1 hypothetical protein TSO352_15635 [Azospirillum sp. TSO35-2]